MGRKENALAERVRCLGLVESYRKRCEDALGGLHKKYGNHKELQVAYDIADKIIKSLRHIEDQIREPERKIGRVGSDFSEEEMERAEKIMAEQNRNPFETEP